MELVKRGEIYLADLGIGTGSEQKGERPVLIIQNDKGNRYSPTVTVIPITTKIHKSYGMPTHIRLGKESGLENVSSAMAEQISTIDKSKLGKCIGRVPESILNTTVIRAIKIQLGIGKGRHNYHEHAGA